MYKYQFNININSCREFYDQLTEEMVRERLGRDGLSAIDFAAIETDCLRFLS